MLIVTCAVLVLVPMHARGLVVVDLHAVHAHIRDLCGRVHGADHGKGDEPAAVIRPALEHGDLREVNLVTGQDDVLTGSLFHGLRKIVGEFGEFRKHLELIHDAGTGPGEEVRRIDDLPYPLSDIIKARDLKGEAHAQH